MNNNENQCEICELFEVFENMIADGIEPIDAFREVVQHAQGNAYEDGLVDALLNVQRFAGASIDHILDPCDCEVCNGECDEETN